MSDAITITIPQTTTPWEGADWRHEYEGPEEREYCEGDIQYCEGDRPGCERCARAVADAQVAAEEAEKAAMLLEEVVSLLEQVVSSLGKAARREADWGDAPTYGPLLRAATELLRASDRLQEVLEGLY